MKAVTLKLGTHMDKWLMYSVYQNQHQGPITLRVTYLDRFYNLPFMNIFVTLFSKKGYKVETKYTHGYGLMYCVYQNIPELWPS